MRITLFSALALFAGTAMASTQVEPVWSSAISDVIPFDANYGRTEHVLLEDGNAFMVAAESSRPGFAATVRLSPLGVPTRGQFGHQPANQGTLRPESILATQGQRVLLSMSETGNPRPVIVMVNSSGEMQWARPRFASQARFLDGGDVLVLAGNELMRLRGSDGELIWLTNLLDLLPNPVSVELQLPRQVVGASASFALHFRDSNSAGDTFPRAPLFVFLNTVTGAIQKLQARESSALPVSETCAPGLVGSDSVHAFFETTATRVDAVVERRERATGNLVWATRIPDVNLGNDERSCELFVGTDGIALSSRGVETSLMALSQAGALRWRTNLATALPTTLRGSVLALLVASQQQGKNGLVSVIERRRVSDGSVIWTTTVPGRAVDLAHFGGEVHLAWSVDGGVSELHLQRRDAVTGDLIVARVAEAEGLTIRPSDMRVVDGIPYTVQAGLGTHQRTLTLRRLDATSGNPQWTSEIDLAESPSQVTQTNIAPGSPGRMLVVVYYQSEDGLMHRQSLLSFNADSGALLWQTAMPRALSNGFPTGAQINTLPDGGAYLASQSCVNPPVCTNPTPQLLRVSAGGQQIWAQPVEATLTGLRGHDLVINTIDTGNTLAILSAETGTELWRQLMPANSFVFSTLQVASGDLMVLRQFNTFNRQRVHLDRRLASSGVVNWTVEPGAIGDNVRSPTLTQLVDGDLLVSARSLGPEQFNVSRPLLARIDGSTGAIEWLNNPLVQGDRWLTVRPLDGATPTHQWARSLRYVGDSFENVEERQALTTVALDTGFIGADHQYGQSYDPALGSSVLGAGFIAAVRPDGKSFVYNRSINTLGLQERALQLWPAPGPHHGDVLLRRSQDDRPIRALGPSVLVDLEVEVNATATINGMTVGFASTVDGLKARLRACQIVQGSGSCPSQLGSSFDQSLSLSSSGRMRLSYEISDPGFLPRQARSGLGARGLFYLNPPFAFGDTNLGNNTAVVQVALGGMSNGFE